MLAISTIATLEKGFGLNITFKLSSTIYACSQAGGATGRTFRHLTLGQRSDIMADYVAQTFLMVAVPSQYRAGTDFCGLLSVNGFVAFLRRVSAPLLPANTTYDRARRPGVVRGRIYSTRAMSSDSGAPYARTR